MPDVEINVTATDKTGGATKAAAEGFDKLGHQAKVAAKAIDNVGDQAGQAARKLLEARAAAMGLAREFDRTGDAEVLKKFEKINREVARFDRASKNLKVKVPEPEVPDGFLGKIAEFGKKAGLIAGEATITSFADVFSAMPGTVKIGLLAGVVGIGAIAAPIIASTIAGAVTAAVGAGGIAAGLMLAAKDSRVADEYGALGTRIARSLTASSLPFVSVLLSSAPKLSAAFDREAPRIARIFSSLSGSLGPIIDSTIRAVHNLMPGIERSVTAAGPILRSMAAQLPGLASAISYLLSALAQAGPGGAAALGMIISQIKIMINVMAFAVQSSAPFLNLFGQMLHFMHLAPSAAKGVSDVAPAVADAGNAASTAAMDYGQLSDSMGNTAVAAQAMNDAFSRLFNAQMGLDQANLAINEEYVKLKKNVEENGHSLDQTTEKGLVNVGMIQQQIQNLEAKRQADIAAGNGTAAATQQANAAYASNVAALRQVLINLGFAASAVDQLIGKYQEIPKNITSTVTTVYRTQGTPPGYSDEKTGHSRTGSQDYSALTGWRPAAFNAATGFMGGTGAGSTTPPVQVHSENAFEVMLDGVPFRAMIVSTTRAAEKRQAWRARVGRRN